MGLERETHTHCGQNESLGWGGDWGYTSSLKATQRTGWYFKTQGLILWGEW